jgi:predicted O-linked N-acetylglucosamine transferase (SPINDLY family)
MTRLETGPGGQRNDVAALFDQAVALFQCGRLAEAKRIARRILVDQPKHAQALHLLGAALSQQGNHTEGLRFIDAALQIEGQSASIHNSRGNVLLALQRFDEAVASYDNAIALKSDFAEAFCNRGAALQELKRFDEALASYDKAIALKPDYAEALCNRGLALQELKRFDEAVVSCDKAIALKPDYAEAFYNCGLGLQRLKRFDEALVSYDKAIALKSDFTDAFCNRAAALRELKRLDEALASYDQAIALKSDVAEAFYSRGIVQHELKRFEEALASFDKAIALKPGYADAFNNRGVALQELKRFEEALASFDKAIVLKPGYADAFNNRGAALGALKRFDEALASYDKAITLKPDYADAFNNRGIALHEIKRFDEALASYERAIALKPDDAGAYFNLGNSLRDQGKRADAVTHYQRALALKPDYAEAKFALCMAQLPILYMDETEIAGRRAAYQESLETLCDDVDGRRMPRDWAEAIGSSQPFFLAYQGYNDRALQGLYGSLVCRIMAERYPPAALCPPPRSDEPVRLGIVSGFFRQHSNWKIPIRGWLSQIDRRRFRVFGYYTGVEEDAETKRAVTLCDRFVHGPLSIDRWRQTILDDAPHVLIYPEIGMDSVSAQLAAQRLAPIQCNSWGHPDTSGFRTLDYYLSSELMEPPEAQDHYTERLVRLPNLSIYYEPLDPEPLSLSRRDLGLRSTTTIYWCGQSLYKYLPQFDQVFPRIAREVDDCQFAFIEYPRGTHVTDLFRKRLDAAFAAFGLRAADYCAFLSDLSADRFVAAIGQCDIVLDSIHWSGCNSTLESLHHDLPIVTMTGPLMRGRHSMAILKMMGVEDTIAETVDDYVSTAIRLARDAAWRTAIRNKISANKHHVYRDSSSISALQQFLDSIVRRPLPALAAEP